jgi:glycosyltransferase involved in cell wall biosynthesis
LQPLVTVRLITYNHEKYIAQCIESILMQRVSFDFEIIIGEDCSTDGTREIVLDYQRRFPHLINVLPAEKNIGAALNSLRTQQTSRGKYQAMLEGDDYWIDPLKLQKQADFMEANPTISMCFHNALILNENTSGVRIFYETALASLFTFEDTCDLVTPTGSVIVRSDILTTLPDWRLNVWCGDVVHRLWCAHNGPLGYLNEIMSVYRVHSGGMVAAMANWRAKARAQEIFLYEQMDRETGHQHTEILQAKIRQVQQRRLRNRNPWLHYLIHPTNIFIRLRQYRDGYRRFKFIKDFGQQTSSSTESGS